MNFSLIFAFIGSGLNTLNDLIYRKITIHSKINTYQFYIIASFSAMITALIINFTIYGCLSTNGIDISYGILLGFLSFLVYILYLFSFSGSSIVVSVTIFRLNMVISTFLAILVLKEHVSVRRAAGIFLCILIVILFALGEKSQTGWNKRPIYLSIGACLFGGLLNLVNKLAVTNGAVPLKLLFWRFLTVSILSCIFISKCKFSETKVKNFSYPIFSGITFLMAIYFILIALKEGDLSLVLPITQLSFVITSLISLVVYGEKMKGFKMVGIILAVAAVFLII